MYSIYLWCFYTAVIVAFSWRRLSAISELPRRCLPAFFRLSSSELFSSIFDGYLSSDFVSTFCLRSLVFIFYSNLSNCCCRWTFLMSSGYLSSMNYAPIENFCSVEVPNCKIPFDLFLINFYFSCSKQESLMYVVFVSSFLRGSYLLKTILSVCFVLDDGEGKCSM